MQKAIKELLKLDINTVSDLLAAKRTIAKKFGQSLGTNAAIIAQLDDSAAAVRLKRLLRKRAVRTLSGIAPVAVLTRPSACPGSCVYCPSEKGVPKSYLSNEPAVMRAIRCGYDPYLQVAARLRALVANGHEPEKIELIVIGGTWSVLPRAYKQWFIYRCFQAANEFEKKHLIYNFKFLNKRQFKNLNSKTDKFGGKLLQEQRANEKAKYRIIGITVETRPDYINVKELKEMRTLGVTRVELGVQATDDRILKLNRRGHGMEETARATALLKDFGLKVTYHIMPGLPGATPAKDLDMFKRLFTDGRFQPDQIKFYPTVVTRGSLLYRWWKAGKYRPYSDRTLWELIVKCKRIVPPYMRIIRLIRDIPAEAIVAGNKVTNLRQILQDKGVKCMCIRCREAKDRKLEIGNWKLEIIKYPASDGIEYFLQAIGKKQKKNVLYGFCRLRLPRTAPPAKKNSSGHTALIRELHVYGELVPVGASTGRAPASKVQHAGLGRRLMAEAERIARARGYGRIAVTAGVGVRPYYRRLGYRLRQADMIKRLPG